MTHTTLKLAVLLIGLGLAAFTMAQSTTPQSDTPPASTSDPAQPQPQPMPAQPQPVQSPATAQQPPDQQVEGALTEAGYSNVANVQEESPGAGIWAAEARNPQGQQVSLRIDAKTGSVEETPAETEEAE